MPESNYEISRNFFFLFSNHFRIQNTPNLLRRSLPLADARRKTEDSASTKKTHAKIRCIYYFANRCRIKHAWGKRSDNYRFAFFAEFVQTA